MKSRRSARPSALHQPKLAGSREASGQIEHPYSHVAAFAQPRDRRCALRKRAIGGGESTSVGNRGVKPRDQGHCAAKRSGGFKPEEYLNGLKSEAIAAHSISDVALPQVRRR
jgi:hypothetical protein